GRSASDLRQPLDNSLAPFRWGHIPAPLPVIYFRPIHRWKEKTLQLPGARLASRKPTSTVVLLLTLMPLLLLILISILSPAALPAATVYDWLQFNGNPQHSGNNTQERIISAASVNGLWSAFRATLPSVADGAPVYLSGVSVASGKRDLLFVTT